MEVSLTLVFLGSVLTKIPLLSPCFNLHASHASHHPPLPKASQKIEKKLHGLEDMGRFLVKKHHIFPEKKTENT